MLEIYSGGLELRITMEKVDRTNSCWRRNIIKYVIKNVLNIFGQKFTRIATLPKKRNPLPLTNL